MQSPEKNNFSLSSLKVGFVLPTFNEYENIFELLKRLDSIFNNKFVVIVDDSTNDYIKEKISLSSDIQYFKRQSKLGRGSAVLYGFKKLLENQEIDLFVEMDTDLVHNPNELPNNIKNFLDNKLDLLIMSRYVKESEIINYSLSRRIFSFLVNSLAKFLLKVPVSDYTMGYRIYSREAIAHVINTCGKIGGGHIVLSEMLTQIYLANFRIGETKTKFVIGDESKSSVGIKLILCDLFGLFKLYFNNRKKIKLTYKRNFTK